MSFFQSIVRNVKEFYSEINAATLTGAIDVIVVEQEDGSFRSSPFHVRFGKLGVLKAREKIVDLEINGEPVEIHMKLDDSGAAFFVEDVEVEDNDWSPDLATSPIPDQSSWDWAAKRRQGVLQPQLLFPSSSGSSTAALHLDKEYHLSASAVNFTSTEAQTELTEEESKKGKLNKKKRRRRQQIKHSRKGSKSSLKDIAQESEQDMFYMEDVNDADQEDEIGMPSKDQTPVATVASTTAAAASGVLPRNFSLDFAESFSMVDGGGGSPRKISQLQQQLGPVIEPLSASQELLIAGQEELITDTTSSVSRSLPHTVSSPLLMARSESIATTSEELTIENSLIGSRVPLIPRSISDAKALEALLNGVEHQHDLLGVGAQEDLVRSKSVPANFRCFSDTELDHEDNSPLPSRPGSPVASDSELELGGREEQPSWRWGELPSPPHPAPPVHQPQTAAAEPKEPEKPAKRTGREGAKSSFIDWFRSSKKEERKEGEGMYLDDLISGHVDPETAAIYLSPSHLLPPDPALTRLEAQDPLSVVDHPRLPVNEAGKSPTGGEEEQLMGGAMHVPGERREAGGRDDDCESGHGPSLPMSPHSVTTGLESRRLHFHSDSEDDLPGVVSRHLPDFAMSLCGRLSLQAGVSPEQFEAHQLSYGEFVERVRQDKNFLNNPSLVVRVNEKYTSFSMAAPILMSVLMFKEPLPTDLAEELTKEGLSVNITMTAEQVKQEKERKEREEGRKYSSWFGWFSSSSTPATLAKDEKPKIKEEPAAVPELDVKKEEPDQLEEQEGEEEEEQTVVEQRDLATQTDAQLKERRESANSSCSSEGESSQEAGSRPARKWRKTLRLDSAKLKELNLKPGSNEVQFSVTTAFQGTTRCKCHIYLWHHTDKIVISDIDGTITKSDVLGHILPVIGRDWAQSGVAELFTKIRNNGYHIMYLSARAIGQATITKDYLQSVKQGDVTLPDGPLFLNPESLIHAFRKEVIDRNPEEFKIRCLKDIQSLFEGKNPFFAGYGNRPNDAYAYRAVGIPVSRIFTINPAGELRHELTQNFQTSYTYQSVLSDHYFPPLGKDGYCPELKQQEFSSFAYWRESPEEPDLADIEAILKPKK